MSGYSGEELSEAFWRGFSDGYDDIIYTNPYDSVLEKELHDNYELGFDEGQNNS